MTASTPRQRRRVRFGGLGIGAALLAATVVGAGPAAAVAVDVTVLTSLPVRAQPSVGLSDAGVSAFTMIDVDTHLSTPVVWDGVTATTTMPPGGTSAQVVGINAPGATVGFSYFGGLDTMHAWVREPGGSIAVEAIGGGTTSRGIAVNDEGLALVLLTTAGVTSPAVWSPPAAPEKIMVADPLVGTYEPRFLNDAGQVLSSYGSGLGQTFVLWDPATPTVTTPISPPPGFVADAAGLADDGSVLFTASDDTTKLVYLWKDGVVTPVADPAFPNPGAAVMNPRTTQVAGVADDDRSFSWTRSGGFVALDCASADQPRSVSAVNDSGYVVGSCGLDDGAKDQDFEPTVWTPAGVRQGLGFPTGFVSGSGFRINPAGRIAGDYLDAVAGHETNPFLATVVFAPSAPQALTGVAGVGSASLTWSPPADDGLEAPTYRVYANGVQVGTTDGATTFVQTGLAAGVAVSYQVVAVNAGGASVPSGAAVVTPLAAPVPAVPAVPAVPVAAVAVVVTPAFTG